MGTETLQLHPLRSIITSPREHNTVAAINELLPITSMGWFYATFYNAFNGTVVKD